MKIRIPKAYDRAMDWIAFHIMPPNKPTRLKIFGYIVTWLDLSVVAYGIAIATGLSLIYGHWLFWFPATAFGLAFAWLAWGHR